MRNLLQQLCNEKQLASIYTSDDLSRLYFGRIIAVDDNWMLLHRISAGGFDDGLLLKHIDDVTRVDTYGQYTEKMKKLCELHLTDFCDEKYNIDPVNILFSVFTYTKKSNRIITVELLGDDDNPVIGFVDDISSNETCRIKTIDEFGYEDGYSFFDFDDLSKVSCDSVNCNKFLDLWKANR